MPPIIGANDEFEGQYTEKFRSLARPHGVFVQYERDRAAIDLGVHLTRDAPKGREVSHTRIWFQLKGIKSATFSYEDYVRSPEIKLVVSLDHLKFWFASPEPTYLAVYVECVDKFFVEDVQDIVYGAWGEDFLRPDTFLANQTDVTVKLSKHSELIGSVWAGMRHHQSMRTDGPFFRGRPLGHRLDPLRCTLGQLEPAAFTKLIRRLLDVHGYHVGEVEDPAVLFGTKKIGPGHAFLSMGRLYYTFEWVHHMETEFGIGPEGDFRIEGKPHYAQGSCAVFIHGDTHVHPDTEAVREYIRSLSAKGIQQFLVFGNLEHDPAYFGTFFSAVRRTDVNCVPLMLNEVAYCLLTTTMVYMEFREAVSWRAKNYIWQDIPPGT